MLNVISSSNHSIVMPGVTVLSPPSHNNTGRIIPYKPDLTLRIIVISVTIFCIISFLLLWLYLLRKMSFKNALFVASPEVREDAQPFLLICGSRDFRRSITMPNPSLGMDTPDFRRTLTGVPIRSTRRPITSPPAPTLQTEESIPSSSSASPLPVLSVEGPLSAVTSSPPGRGILLFIISGGILNGYCSAVAGGVAAMPKFLWNYFYNNSILSQLAMMDNFCQFSDESLGLFLSTFSIFAIIGMLLSIRAHKEVRRPWIAIAASMLSMGGSEMMMMARNAYVLFAGRMMTGLSVGITVEVIQSMIMEIQPKESSEKFGAIFSICSIIGSLIAYVVNFFSADHLTHGWLASFGGNLIFGVLFFTSSIFFVVLEENVQNPNFNVMPLKNLFVQPIRQKLILAIMVKLYARLIGMDALNFFAPALLTSLGYRVREAYITTIAMGMETLVFVMICVMIARKLRSDQKMQVLIMTCIIVPILQAVIGTFIIKGLSRYFYPTEHTAQKIVGFVSVLLFAKTIVTAPGGLSEVQFPRADERMAFVVITSIDYTLEFFVNQFSLPVTCSVGGWVFVIPSGFTAFLGCLVLLLLCKQDPRV